jgi:transposase
VIKSIGSSRDPEEIERLVELGNVFIQQLSGQYSLFPRDEHDNTVVFDFIQTLHNDSVRTIGPELIFGRLFDEIGFNAIPEKLFRDIVVARLVYPTSKVKTVDYIYRYQGKIVSADSIYLFLDRLTQHHREQAQKIAYSHSLKILKHIHVVFYDMTSLYFEAEDEDDLRRIGFSKDGKFQNPQIMLGLLVGENGYPIGYDIFEGNTFEGKTLMPVLQRIQKAYDFGKPVVIADSAMLSQKNLDALDRENYPFIVAARIRNETETFQEEILDRCRNLSNGQSVVLKKDSGHRLIITYSEKRAKKDQYNRERGLIRLRKQIASGRLSKEQLNNRGYNKFLKLTGEMSVEIDKEKIMRDICWDGLKGYLTNTGLSTDEVVESYGQLWHIERAFRISKTDLRIRPMYHRLRRRIEAHVLVAFVAYTICKELERRLKEAGIPMSAKRAAELTQTMYEISFNLPTDPHTHRVLLQMNDEQRQLYDLLY